MACIDVIARIPYARTSIASWLRLSAAALFLLFVARMAAVISDNYPWYNSLPCSPQVTRHKPHKLSGLSAINPVNQTLQRADTLWWDPYSYTFPFADFKILSPEYWKLRRINKYGGRFYKGLSRRCPLRKANTAAAVQSCISNNTQSPRHCPKILLHISALLAKSA